MAKHPSTNKLPREPDSTARPQINTYDSGYEHSVEHWFELRRLFTEEADETRRGVLARLLKQDLTA
jgi:hypothetical protein